MIGAATLVSAIVLCKAIQYAKSFPSQHGSDQCSDNNEQSINNLLSSGGSKSSATSYRPSKITILYGTTTGTAKAFAYNLQQQLLRASFTVQICDLAHYDEDQLEKEDLVLFLCSTWTNGAAPDSCSFFFEWAKDYAFDFRVSKNLLGKVKFAVFGLGAELYGSNFCKAAKELDGHIRILGGQPLLPPTSSDTNATPNETTDVDIPGYSSVVIGDDASDLEDKFIAWSSDVLVACGVDRELQGRLNENSGSKYMKSRNRYQPATATGTGTATGTASQHQQQQMDGSDTDDVSDSGSTASSISKRQQKKLAYKEYKKLVKKPRIKASQRNYSTRNYPITAEEGDMLAKNGTIALGKLNQARRNGYFIEDSSSDVGSTTTASTGCCSEQPADGGSNGSCGCANNGSHNTATTGATAATVDVDEEEEEDRINNTFITMDTIADDTDLPADEHKQSANTEKMEKAVMDLEDIGSSMSKFSQEQRKDVSDGLIAATNTNTSTKNTTAGAGAGTDDRREMATKLQRKALSKEGYKLIGSHSAVKLCRWTKHQLRGRGGCYKHSFYGITSYQCMEATPSLACANKCVFCWRHHKNPVGTEWRWKEDDPEYIVEEGIRLHRAMINEFKGSPGVKPERLAEAFNVQHCALSLVGEPIMYPRINEMLTELHIRHISSFLVTNAQFPDAIESLQPVTQLYVSVDASTRDSLKAIDRPLFGDFWERYLRSLTALREKQQRTVYRMTLVKDWNMEQAEGYAELIELGQPDLIEIKSVTYCGKSDASSLTMEHVPWHDETCAYAEALGNRLSQRGMLPFKYSIATEHQHSCCILLAREDKYKPNGVWHTWINYPKFHALMQEYYQSGGKKTFSSTDYIAPTPDWALYKSRERGFDPQDQRFYRNKNKELVEFEYKASDSGCG